MADGGFSVQRGRLCWRTECFYTAGMAKFSSRFDFRPVFLDLRRIHFPVGAVVSILHRISGVVLILAVPGALFLAEYSSRSATHFRWVADLLDGVGAAVAGALLLAVLAHHLAAGVRLMLIDAGVGVALSPARRSAWGSLAVAGLAGLAALVTLWPEAGASHGQ